MIFEETADSHPFEWWEWWIGDAAYDRCAGVVCRFVQAAESVLEAWQVFWNKELNRPRQRVEHTMVQVKSHQGPGRSRRGSQRYGHASGYWQCSAR